MVVHPASGRVIVGGGFNTLNGSQQWGMGSLDGITGDVQPWAANTVIKNHGSGASINSLTTDGEKIYGVGWTFVGGGSDSNFEGQFSADPMTGVLDWIDAGRGDNYDIAVAGDVLYTVGHPHDAGMFDWNPHNRSVGIPARGRDQQAQVTDADERVRDSQRLAVLPRLSGGPAVCTGCRH